MRIKEQKRFEYKKWLFVLSKTWTGKSRTDADRAHMTQEPVYEVEVECTQLPEVVDEVQQQYTALSLIMKITDFYPPLKESFLLLPFL